MAGKYDTLRQWLSSQAEKQERLHMSFGQIEAIIGQSLPPSAFTHAAWWYDRSPGTTHTQAYAWMDSGWKVEHVDLTRREVVFRRT